MASNRYGNTSPEPSQRQDNKFSDTSRQEPVPSQQERAVKESSRILQDITGNPKGYQVKSDSGWSKKKRIPRLYYINKNNTILIILQGDITRTKVDAIVNAANQHMTGGSGVDGIIHDAAGNDLYDACVAHKQISKGVRLPTGHSRILLSYKMSPMPYHIINTAGPVYRRREATECANELASCYKTALALANLYDLESIGFTAISCGIFGYPADDGADVALRTVDEKADSMPVVVFVLWDNHIYDAWIQKAEELKLIPFDPASPTITAQPSKSSTDDNPKIIENPTVTKDEQGSPNSFNLKVVDLSTQNEKDKGKPEDDDEQSLLRLPSVPAASSNTQEMESVEEDDKSTDNNPQLITQETVEMANVNPEKEGSTTNDNSQEENNKSDDEKTKTEATKDKEEPPHHAATNNSEKTTRKRKEN